jgi:hypothetical protein
LRAAAIVYASQTSPDLSSVARLIFRYLFALFLWNVICNPPDCSVLTALAIKGASKRKEGNFMNSLKNIRLLTWLTIILALSLSLNTHADDSKKDKQKEESYKGQAVLWQEPVDISSRDLFWGPGGQAMKPNLRSITFIKEEKGGYSTKYRVRDGSGRVWVAKVSKESQPETVANRLMWAVGYATEISYLVPRVNIEGRGSFERVKFEARPEHIKRLDTWSWDENPFKGTREFQGLKVMMLLFNNWDIKDDNNKILVWRNETTGASEIRYIVSDLGGTFGKTGNFITRSRNKPEDFVKAKFIEEVKSGYVSFYYGGKRRDLFKNITAEDAAWLSQWLTRLSEQQVRDAFRAADYSPEEIEMLTQSFRARVAELHAAAQKR